MIHQFGTWYPVALHHPIMRQILKKQYQPETLKYILGLFINFQNVNQIYEKRMDMTYVGCKIGL